MLWFGHDCIMGGEQFEFCVSWMPKNAHKTNIFNLEFGHEKFTLTFPVSEGGANYGGLILRGNFVLVSA